MESEGELSSSSSSASMVEDYLSCAAQSVTSISDVKVKEPQASDGSNTSEQDSFESCELSPSCFPIAEHDSSFISGSGEETSVEPPEDSKASSPIPSDSNQKNSTLESSNQVLLKRGSSNTSFSSVRAPNKKIKDSPAMKIQTTLKKEVEDAADSKDSITPLDKLLQPFEQYLKEQESARLQPQRTERKPRKAERDIDTNFVSIRDLPFVITSWKPADKITKTFKPKQLLPKKDGEKDRLLLRVFVSAAQDPTSVYVTFPDEDRISFEEMLDEMRLDLLDAVKEIPNTWIGHVCAVKFRDHWHRALVEKLQEDDQVEVFLVDSGHRVTIPMESCFKLPDRYLELPAQAVRCALDGLQPASKRDERTVDYSDTWDEQALSYLRQLDGRKGLAQIERVSLGQVGKLPNSKEFAAHAILHADSEIVSANRYLCDGAYAITDKMVNIPNWKKILLKFLADELSDGSFSDQEEDMTSRSSVISRRSTEASSSVIETVDMAPSWLEHITARMNEDYYDEWVHEPAVRRQISSGNYVIYPAGARIPDGNNEKSFRRKNPLALENGVRSLPFVTRKPDDEVCLGPLLFSWCESPNAIYAQTEEMRDKLSRLVKDMNNHYENAKPSDSGYIEIGYKCAVHCDGCWWRAEVIENENHPLYQVHLMDRGFQRTVNASDVRPLEDAFQEIEKLMHRLFLSVFPKTGYVWEDDVKLFITERLLEGEDINFRYNKHEQFSKEFLVGSLFYTYELEEGPLQAGGRMKINLRDELTSLDLASTRQTLPKYSLKPKLWQPATYPNVGDRFWAKVTWVNIRGQIFLHDVRAEKKLEEISRMLTERYENTKPTKADINPKPGDICIAKYSDGKWYRCVVNEVHPNEGTATLIYEDYGTKDASSLRDIRLDVILEDIPKQAWPCKIHNIKPVGEYWEWETLTAIHNLIVEHEFVCKVVARHSDFLTVILISEKGKLLSSELVRKGLASYETTPGKKNVKPPEVIVLSDSDDDDIFF